MNSNTISTSEYILEKVAPIFNKQGYVGTSLSDLTKATNLTKGAIYCNFLNKEELALKSFELNVKKVVLPLEILILEQTNAVQKLFAITKYYRNYYDLANSRGGCPILNVGLDARFINPLLFNAAKKTSENLVNGLTSIIKNGIIKNEIQENIESSIYAKNIYAMIEGAIFMAFTHENEDYLINITNLIDSLIEEKMHK